MTGAIYSPIIPISHVIKLMTIRVKTKGAIYIYLHLFEGYFFIRPAIIIRNTANAISNKSSVISSIMPS
jgi:c-di-GMP-related signal transduction protein